MDTPRTLQRLPRSSGNRACLVLLIELQRFVALKVPRHARLASGASQQVLRKARTAAAISHPNVGQVYEVGQYDESFYIACKLIKDISLSEHLNLHSVEPRFRASKFQGL